MLVECPECNKKVSDTAPSCPHCGFSLSPNPRNIRRQSEKTAIFQFLALGGIWVVFYTPVILASIVCLFIIATGTISLLRNEPRSPLSAIFIAIGILLIVSISTDLSSSLKEDKSYLSKVGLEAIKWTSADDAGYSYVKGRVRNKGDRTVQSFKVVASFYDDSGNMLDMDSTYGFDELMPGAAKEFEIIHKQSKQHKKMDIHIIEVRTK